MGMFSVSENINFQTSAMQWWDFVTVWNIGQLISIDVAIKALPSKYIFKPNWTGFVVLGQGAIYSSQSN